MPSLYERKKYILLRSFRKFTNSLARPSDFDQTVITARIKVSFEEMRLEALMKYLYVHGYVFELCIIRNWIYNILNTSTR